MATGAAQHQALNAARHGIAGQEIGDKLHAIATRGNLLSLGIHGIETFAIVAGGLHPLNNAAGNPLQTGVQQAGLAVEFHRGTGGVVLSLQAGLSRAQHQDFPGAAGKEGLVLLHAAAKQGKLRVVARGNHRHSIRQAQQLTGGGGEGADCLAGIHHGREESLAHTDGGENLIAPVAGGQVSHLGGTGHGAVGGHHAGQAVGQDIGDEEPGVGLLQQLRAVLLEPDKLVNGIEGKLTHAGNGVELCLGHVFGHALHDLGRARALPGNDGVKQFTGSIHQRAVHTKGGDGHRLHLRGINLRQDFAGTGSQLVQNAVCIPHMEIRVLCPGISRIRLAGFSYQLPLVINEDGAHIRGAAV